MNLIIENLTYEYPNSYGAPALNRLTATIPSGGVTALIGPNGAGKSTLSKVLNGILKIKSGRICMERNPVHPFCKPGQHVAYAFQNPDNQLFLPTVWKELEYGLHYLEMTPSEIERNCNEALQLLDIEGLKHKHPLDLPFVLRKRVSLAIAIAAKRKWTVIDEPTVGQDPGYCDHLVTVIKCLQKDSYGFILISHEPEFVFRVCDYMVVMSQGRCAWEGDKEDFIKSPPDIAKDFVNLPVKLSRDSRLSEVTCSAKEFITCLQKIADAKNRVQNQKTFFSEP